MAHHKIHRRDLLKSAAMTALLLPIMRTTMAKAAPGPGGVRRLITFFTPNGLNYPDAGPRGSGATFTLGDYYAALAPHKADLIALSGMHIGGVPYGNNRQIGHTSGAHGCLTCTTDEGGDNATGPSIDQFVAQKLREQNLFSKNLAPVYGIATSNSAHPNDRTYFEGTPGATKAVSLQLKPVEAYNAAFKDVAASTGEDINKVIARRKSVLDAAWQDCKSYIPALPSDGKQLLEYHCTRIRELEQGLAPAGACSPPKSDLASVAALDVNDARNYPLLTDFFFKLMTVSLSCDLTRVASFAIGNGNCRITMPFVSGIKPTGNTDVGNNAVDHHTHTHQGNNRQQVGLFMNWYSQQVAKLVTSLKEVRPDGTRLLDSTNVFWTTDYGAAKFKDHDNHGDVPMFVFGSGGGKFKQGIGLQSDQKYDDASHTHALMVSLIHAMGITNVNQFGHVGGGSGVLPQIMV